MNTDLVLVSPPITLEERYGSLAWAGNTLPSLGLLSLASSARKSNFTCAVVEAASLGLDYASTLSQVLSYSPRYVGITATTVSVLHAAKLAQLIKEKNNNIITIIGGPHLTAVPVETLSRFPSFDIGIMGEGERTLVTLLTHLDNKDKLSGVPGLVYRENGSILTTERGPLISNLDEIPYPAWDLLSDFPWRYRPAAFKYKRLPATYILTTRGCPRKCIFCDTAVFKGKIRVFGVKYVLDMIELLYRKYGIRELAIEDDTFMCIKPRLIEICEELLKRKIDISWSCNGRVDDASLEVLVLMKKTGCWQIGYGIESGDQKVLDFSKKGITLDKVEQAVRWTREAGIRSKGFFILGFPIDNDETMRATINFAKRITLDDISVNFMTPLPGSEIYATASKYGDFALDWQKMNMQEVVFIPKDLSKEKLHSYHKTMLREFYLRPRIIFDYLLRIIESPGTLPGVSKGFIAFLKKTL